MKRETVNSLGAIVCIILLVSLFSHEILRTKRTGFVLEKRHEVVTQNYYKRNGLLHVDTKTKCYVVAVDVITGDTINIRKKNVCDRCYQFGYIRY
jgi:branched-subunit amino acid transport protein AzlD